MSAPMYTVQETNHRLPYRNSWQGQIGLNGQLSLQITVWLGLGLELGFQDIDLFLGQAWACQVLGIFLVVLDRTKVDFAVVVVVGVVVRNGVGVYGRTELRMRHGDSEVDKLVGRHRSVAVEHIRL